MSLLVFDVPSGIGDTSWIYSKLVDIAMKRTIHIRICGDEPRRTSPFVDLLPGVVNLGYGGFYRNMLKRVLPYQTDLSIFTTGEYALSLNPHLEAGQRIEKAYPKQKTHYHYPLNTTPRHKDLAGSILAQAGDRPRIGYYCSSHKHRPNMGFWLEPDWVRYLNGILSLVPNAQLVAVGATYDDKTSSVHNLMGPLKSVSAVGNEIGTTLEVLRGLDYFVAFPSGLGVMCDVLLTPCTMFYWSNIIPHCAGFPDSYADPESIKTHRHVILPYVGVDTALEAFAAKGLPWIDQRMKSRG